LPGRVKRRGVFGPNGASINRIKIIATDENQMHTDNAKEVNAANRLWVTD
jgi:hypothetical protein